MSNDYTSLSKPKITENYKVTAHEESIYNEVAEELSNNIRKEGLWLKALQNTNEDENKTLSLYIKYRTESIKKEKEKEYAIQKEKEVKINKVLNNIKQKERLKEEKIYKKQETKIVAIFSFLMLFSLWLAIIFSSS